MAEFAQRALGAIVGAVITDAAALPIEWVYDAEKLNKEILKGKDDPEFFEENHCPFFTLPSGKSTFYAEEMFILLESLLEAKGWNREVYRKKLFERFGPGTKYDHEAQGIDLEKKPIKAPWQSTIMRKFICHYQGVGGIYDKDPMIETATQVAPLVALYAGKPELKTYLEELSSTLQDSEIASEICVTVGLILEQLILHGSSKDTISILQQSNNMGDLSKGLAKEVQESLAENITCTDAIGAFGRHCGAQACFKGGLYAMSCGKEDFVASNRISMKAGGDVCGRGTWIGALMGARAGLDALPKSWIEKTELSTKTIELAKQLIELR